MSEQTNVDVCIYVCVCIHVYMYICICMYIRICKYVYIYVYIMCVETPGPRPIIQQRGQTVGRGEIREGGRNNWKQTNKQTNT